jgi:hypothetical protein
MFGFLKRFLAILIGFLLIALFVWYVGPYFGFPLPAARISDCTTDRHRRHHHCWFLATVPAARVPAERSAAGGGRGAAERAGASRRGLEAANGLKRSGRSAATPQRRNLYDLPW